jgi:uncharacterized repeat protein (TIGR02543 family)
MNGAKTVSATFNKTQYALDVAVTGSGSGNVASTPVGVSCPGACQALFDPGTVVALSQYPSVTSTFGGWSGACTSAPCTITMDAGKSVTATFTAAFKAKIGTTGYDSLKAAYTAAGTSATINLMSTELIEDAAISGKDITLLGGYNADFTTRNAQPTFLKGTLTINGGSLRVDGVTVR